jgi:hypothetical protein
MAYKLAISGAGDITLLLDGKVTPLYVLPFWRDAGEVLVIPKYWRDQVLLAGEAFRYAGQFEAAAGEGVLFLEKGEVSLNLVLL